MAVMLGQRLNISCLCGRSSQTVKILGGDDLAQLQWSWQESQKICHCNTCRRITGLLCTSYLPISPPSRSPLDGLVAYPSTPTSTAYFCSACGCHVFSASTADGDTTKSWQVATGAIIGSPDPDDIDPATLIPSWAWEHQTVSDTKDGGLSIWLANSSSTELVASSTTTGPGKSGSSSKNPETSATNTLPASCHCGTVRFHVTRPDASSQLPTSGFPDLEVPYSQTDPDIVENPGDVKWWLRGKGGTKYLAGTCACRSCRLASGFEIQTWAFVPRSNIFMYARPLAGVDTSDRDAVPEPLDFENVPPDVLRSYESSTGVAREFCPRCGATVFWHSKERSELIDVSVGLLDATEGARAETWLEWGTARVSFAEDAGADMEGQQAASLRARSLIKCLEDGLKGQTRD